MFEREDWKLFRNIETLSQRAGVKRESIPALIVKELVDNGLDASIKCDVGLLNGKNGFYVQDYGKGIDEEILVDLFSINRPMITSKLLRLPSRGALGNGLRVVTGGVISTNGELYVSTRGYKYQVIPQDDGTTMLRKVETYNGVGTRVEVIFGSLFPIRKSDLSWGENAIKFSGGERCTCKSSAYWYTSEAFYELANAYNGTIKDLLLYFEGINNAKAKEISKKMIKTKANELNFNETEVLLGIIRAYTKPIGVKKIGYIGENGGGYGEYTKKTGEFRVFSLKGEYNALIPYVVETWIRIQDDFASEILVNKTPVTGQISRWYKGKEMTFYGCGMIIDLKSKPAQVVLNVVTPYMPITSDGKSPNFQEMNSTIKACLSNSLKKAKKLDIILNNSNSVNEKDIIVNNLQNAIAKASGYGQYIFSQRQLYYAIRPYVMNALDKQPEYNYFCRVLTEYENEYGDIKGLYRDPRGTLYHPHLGEEIPLGTIAVNNYKRPKWTFNKILYCEKEGFFPILKDAKFPERFDCALLSSKGYASRAVKDLFDLLGETDEEILFFCIHDSDAPGTMIYQTLQEGTISRAGRKVRVINLGLDPWDALEMGLEVESFESKSRKAVANYVKDRDWKSYDDYEEWLQSNRVELNAMSTPVFLEWLEEKIRQYDNGKVIPDSSTMYDTLTENTKEIVYQKVMQDILKKNGFEDKVNEEMSKLQPILEDKAKNIREEVQESLYDSEHHWTKSVNDIAKKIVNE